jgi:hypothetical protein
MVRALRTVAVVALGLPLGIASADAQDPERLAMAHVRLTTERSVLAGCARVGAVKDDSVKDLRLKIVRTGGNAAVLSFGVDDLETIYAEVYRCQPPPARRPEIPPPPAGPPPPPPPPPAPR